MPAKDQSTCTSSLDVKEILRELEVPFSPDQVQWRVTVTANDRKRGQIVPYADPRAYTDRLNALLSPQGWTREYRLETTSNITRIKKGESFLSGKVFVTCTVTISGLCSNSGTGEAWADDDNGMTSADAQAFKRACACFGLGRYFYDFPATWVDLDQKGQFSWPRTGAPHKQTSINKVTLHSFALLPTGTSILFLSASAILNLVQRLVGRSLRESPQEGTKEPPTGQKQRDQRLPRHYPLRPRLGPPL